MPKFRKKPVVIEAVRYDHHLDRKAICDWIGAAYKQIPDVGHAVPIQTLEGTMMASVGDWIIKGVNGEFYPCKPDIFEKTYEPVRE